MAWGLGGGCLYSWDRPREAPPDAASPNDASDWDSQGDVADAAFPWAFDGPILSIQVDHDAIYTLTMEGSGNASHFSAWRTPMDDFNGVPSHLASWASLRPPSADEVAIANQALYLNVQAGAASAAIARLRTSGEGGVQDVVSSDPSRGALVASNGSDVFFSDAVDVEALDTDSGAVSPLPRLDASVSALVADGPTVFAYTNVVQQLSLGSASWSSIDFDASAAQTLFLATNPHPASPGGSSGLGVVTAASYDGGFHSTHVFFHSGMLGSKITCELVGITDVPIASAMSTLHWAVLTHTGVITDANFDAVCSSERSNALGEGTGETLAIDDQYVYVGVATQSVHRLVRFPL